MSDLQIALIALGALIIAGVVVYNWMQERKLRQNITEEFLVPQKDVITEDFYIDADAYVDKALEDVPIKNRVLEKLNEETPVSKAKPVVESSIAEALATENVKIEATESNTTSAATELEPQTESAPAAARIPIIISADAIADTPSPLPADLHVQVDLTAFLYATKHISAQTLYAATGAIASEMGVPMMVHGCDDVGKWHGVEQAAADQAYKQVACSIQLADRSGPIAKNILNKFQFAVENMGLELGAHVEWQGAGDATQRAVALDQFCMEVDQLISVHLIAGETPIHGTKFRGLAEASGMSLLEDGKFHCFVEHHTDIIAYTLSNGDAQAFTSDSLRNSIIKSAVFQIEIPKVTNSEHAFNQVILVAKKMASSLNAQLVDDNNKPLGDLQIEKIRQQLKVIHATMVARGIMPGSPISARLFN